MHCQLTHCHYYPAYQTIAFVCLCFSCKLSTGKEEMVCWHRYMVLPQRPAGTEGWSEQQLQALVTRDSMIGVTLAKQPEKAA